MIAADLVGAGKLAVDIGRLHFDRSTVFAEALRTLVKPYTASGTALLSRFDDCEEAIRREADFENVYEPMMRDMCGEPNFFLGMQDTHGFTRDVANVRLTVRREDLDGRLAPFVARMSAGIIDGCNGRLDVPQDLTLPIQFGVPGPTARELCRWTTLLFWYAFYNLDMHDHLTQAERDAAARLRAHLDELIAARKASGEDRDDMLGRYLKLQAAGLDGMDDLDIRTNVMGLLIALVPTISKATVQALAQMIHRPDALAAARPAAAASDMGGISAHIFEAMRFDPFSPVIFRRAVRDSGTMVPAANIAAMFDPIAVARPGAYDIARPWQIYMPWGFGRRMCFGAYINQTVVPQVVAPLVAKSGLRRAEGIAVTCRSSDLLRKAHALDPTTGAAD
eukprot:gene19540-19975_t